MKLLFDLFPVVLFFLAYKQYDIYVATGVLMVATAGQITFSWLRHRKVEKLHVVTFVVVLAFGGLTVFLRNPVFIKWKPTIVYGLLALAFLGSQFVGARPLTRALLGTVFELSDGAWRRLNLVWTVFFVAMAALNLIVAYRFSEDTWVNFKLFGLMGLTLAFVVGQSVVLRQHLVEPASDPGDVPPAVEE